jgi:hypothetical protein
MLALRFHPPANIERYLWAELVYIPFVLSAAWSFGVWSWQYAAVYCLFTVPILYAVCRIAWDCLRDRRWHLRPIAICFVLAGILTRMAFLGAGKPLGRFMVISLVEGFILAWAGVLTAFTAPYTRHPDLLFPLAMLWLVQAAYSFGWTLNFKEWGKLNWLVPPCVATAAFLVLAWRLRVPHEMPRMREGQGRGTAVL